MRAAAYVGLAFASLMLGCPSDPAPEMMKMEEPPPPAECGNGRLEMGEQCEGQPVPDGCDPSSCTVLDGFNCEPEPPAMIPTYEDTGGEAAGDTDPPLPGLEWSSTCMLLDLCEDGVVDMLTMEECDDGNAKAGDGCTDCVVDIGYTCMGEPSVCRTCGDGWLDENLGEECDTGTLLGNDSLGCTDDCTIMEGWECVQNPLSSCGPICGDGIWLDASLDGVTIGVGEECDDGNLMDGDGCDSDCEIEDTCECNGVPPETSDCICGLGTTGTDTGESTGTDTGTGTTGDTDSTTAGTADTSGTTAG